METVTKYDSKALPIDQIDDNIEKINNFGREETEQQHRDDRSNISRVQSGDVSWRENTEKFELGSAMENLRQHMEKLEHEKKEQKMKDQAATKERLRLSPGNAMGHENLYELGKMKLINQKKEGEKSSRPSSRSSSPPEIAICERLYLESLSKQAYGKKKREEIDRQRQLSNPRPSELPSPTRRRESFPGRTKGADSPTPEEITERLYCRSIPLQESGKERKEEIDRMRAASNPKPPLRVRGTSPSPIKIFTPRAHSKSPMSRLEHNPEVQHMFGNRSRECQACVEIQLRLQEKVAMVQERKREAANTRKEPMYCLYI